MNRTKQIAFLLFTTSLIAFSALRINGCGEKKAPAIKALTEVDGELSGKLQSILDEYRESNNIMGISAAVTLPGDRIWLGAGGMSSETDSVSTDMLFGIGSVTKSYIAAMILKYVEEDRISLDDNLGKWLPEIDNVRQSITIRQLLNHTSGLYNYMAHPEYNAALFTYPDTLWTSDELLKSFLQEPAFEPGAGWGYSATNYILLGKIIEKISGNTVAYELKERILKPLDLENTYLYPDEIYPAERMAHLWFVVDTTGVPVDISELVSPPPLRGLFSSVWTAGAINATAEDVVKWFNALFSGRVLTDSLFRDMITASPASGDVGYGLGVMNTFLNNEPAVGHSGGIGYSSLVYYIPADSIGIAILANSHALLDQLASDLHEACLE